MANTQPLHKDHFQVFEGEMERVITALGGSESLRSRMNSCSIMIKELEALETALAEQGRMVRKIVEVAASRAANQIDNQEMKRVLACLNPSE